MVGAPLNCIHAVHSLQPFSVDHFNVTSSVQLALNGSLPLVRASFVQRGENLIGNACCDIGDVKEGICEGRRGKLVVLRERAGINIEALRSGVRDNDIGDVRTRVVDRECNGQSLSSKKGEERIIRRKWCAVSRYQCGNYWTKT